MGGGRGDVITGVTVSTNFAGWSDGRLSFGDHTISANWESLAFDNNSYFNLSISQVESQPVPESGATLPLLAAAVAGLICLRRRSGATPSRAA